MKDQKNQRIYCHVLRTMYYILVSPRLENCKFLRNVLFLSPLSHHKISQSVVFTTSRPPPPPLSSPCLPPSLPTGGSFGSTRQQSCFICSDVEDVPNRLPEAAAVAARDPPCTLPHPHPHLLPAIPTRHGPGTGAATGPWTGAGGGRGTEDRP